MTIAVRREPLSFYIDKLERGEPFTSLLYGDGEFLVAAGRRTGSKMQNEELVTESLVKEMFDSLDSEEENLYRGTDPSIADPSSYGGRDIESVRAMHNAMLAVTEEDTVWYDGTVWEEAVRCGELGPLIKTLRRRDVYLIANPAIYSRSPLTPQAGTTISEKNACRQLERIYLDSLAVLRSMGQAPVVVCCAGMSTIPLLMRLRRKHPHATLLDLGSTFDLFAKIGQRGWQQELYRDEAAWQALVAKNLEGSK